MMSYRNFVLVLLLGYYSYLAHAEPEIVPYIHSSNGLSLLEEIANLEEVNYTHYERRDFYLTGYLEKNYPDLLVYRDHIGHWSGYYRIHPIALLSLIETESEYKANQFSISPENSAATSTPFSTDGLTNNKPPLSMGRLSSFTTIEEQIRDVSNKIFSIRQDRTEKFYSAPSSFKLDFLNKFSELENKPTLTPEGKYLHKVPFTNIKNNQNISSDENLIFTRNSTATSTPITVNQDNSNGDGSSSGTGGGNNGAASGPPPPYGFLQLPYLRGVSWRFGGTHHNYGTSNRPYSALDFSRYSSSNWGSYTGDKWVASAHAGKVTVYSSCSVEVFGPPGFGEWSTSYYHLDNVQVQDKQLVNQNVKLAVYASNQNQALCQGGSSTGPHVHFNLNKADAFYDLHNVPFSEYVHKSLASIPYEGDCNLTWMDKNGTKYCPNISGNLLNSPSFPIAEYQDYVVTISPQIFLLLD